MWNLSLTHYKPGKFGQNGAIVLSSPDETRILRVFRDMKLLLSESGYLKERESGSVMRGRVEFVAARRKNEGLEKLVLAAYLSD